MLPVLCSAGNKVPKDRISSVISDYSGVDGFESVKLGTLGSMALKFAARSVLDTDDELIRNFISLADGIRKISIIDYEDCDPEVRRQITGRLDRALSSTEVLMEAKDGGDAVKIYGSFNSDSGKVRDLVMYVPSDCTLVCLFGNIPLDALSKLAE